MTGYKVLTHTYCPPLQSGAPLWDGTTLPYTLPPVALDASDRDCAPGYHYCDSPAGALRIAGLWPDGWPACVVGVTPSADAIERGKKGRASQLTITRRLGQDEIRAAVREMSAPFGEHAEAMAEAQMEWYEALGRPHHDVELVEAGLREALSTMGLNWTVKRFDSPRAAWDAGDAWEAGAAWEARAAWAAWDAWDAGDAWEAGAAWEARAAWAAWEAWEAGDAWEARAAWAAWEAWEAGDAWDAWAALTWRYAALMGWVEGDPAKLTVGRIDAYRYGAAIILPTGPNVLGYTMAEAQ